MAGTSSGAQKAKETNLNKDPNHYANIAKNTWKNPGRSRKVGFAAHPEIAKEAGRKGGLKKKDPHKLELGKTSVFKRRVKEVLKETTNPIEAEG